MPEANSGNQEKVNLLSLSSPDQLASCTSHLDILEETKKASRPIHISVGFQLNRRKNSLVSYMIFFVFDPLN